MFSSSSKVESDLLDNLVIAAPCSVSWELMTGDDRARACSQCSRNVYNLSSMTRNEAEAFLAEHGISHCVTFYRRENGTIMTDNCPVGLRKLRDQCRLAAKMVAAAITFLLTPLAAMAEKLPPDTFVRQAGDSEMIYGEPAMVPAPTKNKRMPEKIAGGAIFVRDPRSVQNHTIEGPRPFIQSVYPSKPKSKQEKNGNSDKDKTGTDPYYKLYAQYTELADPTAFNLFSLGKQQLAEGKTLVAKAYFKSALKAFDPANHDWRLRQLVEAELKKIDDMQLASPFEGDVDAVINEIYEDGRPRVIQTVPADAKE